MGTFTTPTTFRGHAPWEYHLLLLRPIQYFFFSFSLFFFADKKLWKYRRGLRGSCNESYSFLRGWATFVPRTDCYEQGGIWAIITVIMESFLLRVMQGEININESMITTFLICLKAKRKAVVIKDCE